jgi:hypothetical protein
MITPRRMSDWSILRENAIQLLMYLIGVVITALLWWPLGLLYAALAIGTNIFYMYWVCPYCGHYALGTCPAGFDLLSGQRFRARLGRTFGRQFRLGTLAVGTGWFLPPIAAAYLLLTSFSWLVLGLLVVFCVVAFWLLPELSKKHCDGCETLDCPRRPKK